MTPATTQADASFPAHTRYSPLGESLGRTRKRFSCARCLNLLQLPRARNRGRPFASASPWRAPENARLPKKAAQPMPGYAAFFALKKAAKFRACYTLAAVRRSVTASVFSQVNSGSSRPKCP